MPRTKTEYIIKVCEKGGGCFYVDSMGESYRDEDDVWYMPFYSIDEARKVAEEYKYQPDWEHHIPRTRVVFMERKIHTRPYSYFRVKKKPK